MVWYITIVDVTNALSSVRAILVFRCILKLLWLIIVFYTSLLAQLSDEKLIGSSEKVDDSRWFEIKINRRKRLSGIANTFLKRSIPKYGYIVQLISRFIRVIMRHKQEKQKIELLHKLDHTLIL